SKPNTVTVAPTSVSVTPGGTANYTVTVNFNGNNNSCTSPLSITTALPAGASYLFAPPGSVTGTSGDQSLCLTTSTTGATPSATMSWRVTGIDTPLLTQRR